MTPYRIAVVTLWQTDEPDGVRGSWSVSLRHGVRNYVTLARGEITSSAPAGELAPAWLEQALEHWTTPLA